MSESVSRRCAGLSACFAPARFIGLGLVAAVLISGGCQKESGVVTYSIPTAVPTQLRAGNERMLAAMVPKGDEVWFFKVTGPEEAIASVESELRTFVTEIRFLDSKPDLSSAPGAWQRGAVREMRYASFDITTPQKQLDLSVSSLPRGADWDEYVAMNVNRWRGQLGLEPSTEKWGGASGMEVESADGEAVWLDVVGKPSSGASMMSPPFAGMASPDASPAPTMASNPASESGSQPEAPGLEYDMPEGWRTGRMSPMRLAAFDVGPEDKVAELTVIPASGDLRGNVARWMGQIRQNGVPDDEVDKALSAVQEIEVDGRPAKRFLLLGDEPNSGNAIDATIVPLEDGMSLFVKMTGPVETVRAESEAIAGFLKSLKL